MYDQAFAEGVIDDLDFDYYSEFVNPSKKVKWRCVDGGTQLVPDKMNSMLKKPLTKDDLKKRVTKIAFHRKDDEHPEDGDTHLSVKVDGEEGMRRYMTVFATPTLACLQRIDLTELELLYEQKDAIRSLHYDTASKVGMQFRYAWVSGFKFLIVRTFLNPRFNMRWLLDVSSQIYCCSGPKCYAKIVSVVD